MPVHNSECPATKFRGKGHENGGKDEPAMRKRVMKDREKSLK